MAKKKKIRADFRKNRNVRARTTDWTRQYRQHGFEDEAPLQSERISGKGELARRRTVCGEEVERRSSPASASTSTWTKPPAAAGECSACSGLVSMVEDESGDVFQCATRRLLKTLDHRSAPRGGGGRPRAVSPRRKLRSQGGLIERVEPRHGCICRAVRGRQQVLVANVDQLAIVASAAEPRLKPNLIDRLLVAAEKGGVRPLICINKIDLVDPAGLQPLVGVYSSDGLRGAAAEREDRLRRRAASPRIARPGQRRGRAERRGQVLAAERHRSSVSPPRAAGERGHREGQAHDDHRPAAAAGRRRLRGRYARHAPVPALGRDAPRRWPAFSATCGPT